MPSFSKKHNFFQQPPITVVEDAPEGLRFAVVQAAYDGPLNYSQIRTVVCRVLGTSPDRGNWSEVPNIRDEVLWEIERCEWYRVYDIAEALLSFIESTRGYDDAVAYAETFNTYCSDHGIGWQFKPNEGIVRRGGQSYEAGLNTAISGLEKSRITNARRELHEAMLDISRRPEPDITGAISHAMAALECTANDLEGTTSTLGQIIKHMQIPKPLDEAVSKLYGYASQNGRHVTGSSKPTRAEAELVVQICAALCSFLVEMSRRNENDG